MIIEDEKFGVKLITNELKLFSADELVEDMHKEYYKYSKLLELAKKDRIEVIKDTIRYMYYSDHLLKNAQKWLSMLKEGVDKRKHYEEKDSFDYLQNILKKEIFINSDIEIIAISFMGYENYLCMIDFKVEDSDIVFQLAIPNVSMLKEKWWDSMYGGKLALLYYQNTNSLYTICTSYKEKEINKAFIDFLNKYEYY